MGMEFVLRNSDRDVILEARIMGVHEFENRPAKPGDFYAIMVKTQAGRALLQCDSACDLATALNSFAAKAAQMNAELEPKDPADYWKDGKKKD